MDHMSLSGATFGRSPLTLASAKADNSVSILVIASLTRLRV